jgi:outer membrane protein
MMKKILFSAAFLVFAAFSSVNAQKIGVIDVTQILQSVPDYKKAQDELDRTAQQWRQEIAQQQDQIKGLYNKFQAEQVLLSDEQKKQREDEIVQKEKLVRDMQRDKFGAEGQLFKKRQELVKPVQDKIYQIIERFANEKGYDILLDKGSASGVIFANPSLDVTQKLIEMLKKN